MTFLEYFSSHNHIGDYLITNCMKAMLFKLYTVLKNFPNKMFTGKVILKDLEKRRAESPTLDPRSASRTPAADREPHYKTRYESPIFACK